MPRGVAPRALLGILALIVAIAVATVPLVDARPKDKDGKRGEVATEEVVPAEGGQSDPVAAEAPPPVEQPLTASEGNAGGDERTLLSSDADGDYIPDALDNCPNVQNPDQADGDGDGNGDACHVYQDLDGDTVPDKSDNCPNIATSDFSDNDGDGVGNPCDKSPDGIEPEPEPVPELNGRGGEDGTEPPAPENGENQDGQSVERDGRERSKQRERTDVERATITTGADGESTGDQPAQEEPPAEEPDRDNPRRNEELLAEAAAAGEIFDPAPPPEPRRAWDESEVDPAEWDSLLRIDAGATASAERTNPASADAEPNDAGSRDSERGNARDGDVEDSEFARGWVRAKLVLQEENQDEPGDGESGTNADPGSDNSENRDAPAPVPVESGLVITGVEEPAPDRDESGDGGAESPADGASGDQNDARDNNNNSNNQNRDRNERSAGQDGSRRDGSSRGRAAPQRGDNRPAAQDQDEEPNDNGRDRRDRERGQGWSDDRYFAGGAALNWSADVDVAGTDDDALYLTQRSGSGPGRKRGFSYAIPVEENGTYLVRLFFAEPYWGAPGGPDGEEGRRVFSVTAEGETILDDLDVYAEVGSLTALVKQVEVQVEDGELNLRFTGAEGEPIVAAIEILQPAE